MPRLPRSPGADVRPVLAGSHCRDSQSVLGSAIRGKKPRQGGQARRWTRPTTPSGSWAIFPTRGSCRSPASSHGAPRIVQVHSPGDLPERPFGGDDRPRMIVVHRHRLSAVDAERLKAYRQPSSPGAVPAIVLCVSPFVRDEELERWSGLADLVISEATAGDILPRHVARIVAGREGRTSPAESAGVGIAVVGGNHDLTRALVEACEAAGHRARPVGEADLGARGRRADATSSPTLSIFDVPVLEPDWPDRLERVAKRSGPVIALIGFADRELVTQAKARGAVACLELPLSVDDLIDVIDRTVRSLASERGPIKVRTEPPHRLPPPPRPRKGRGHPAVARPDKKV